VEDSAVVAAEAAAPRERGAALVFVGFMGAGKSSAARSVAAELGVVALDSDREIERRLGETIESYFAREGEAAFRALEEQTVVELLGRADARVVALGGGALGSDRVRAALAGHTVVHLEIDAPSAWRRASGKGRPLARDRRRFDGLHAERRQLYESLADATLPPTDRGVALRALPALRELAAAPPDTRMVWAATRSSDYPVFFGRGLSGRFFYPRAERRFTVSDTNVARHHPVAGDGYAIPAGEQAKTLATVEAVLRAMAAAGVTRDGVVAAVGGGVVGDLAGFCAAVYQRGIRYTQVPTTLVAQVDSAYGGKTGVDLPEGKNYAGAYHQPAAVIADPAVLETLPRAELAAGYAEVVKTALIAGGDLWSRVRSGAQPDDEVIWRCLRTKLTVVAGDERDAGRRQVLNLGHTVAHAIEAATGYARYRHGEAVAIGLLCALRLSGRDVLRREVAALLERHGLPVRFEGADVETVLRFLARDKKRRGDEVPFVLVEAPGNVSPGHAVPEREVRAAVAEVRG
jgi:shikimate kinase / 3-dehydroquinate synthase